MMKKKNRKQTGKPEIYSLKKESGELKVERRDFLLKLGLLTGAAVAGCNEIDKRKVPGGLGEPVNISPNLKTTLCDDLLAHSGCITTLCFIPDGKLLASGANNGDIKLWSVPGGKLLTTIHDNENTIPVVFSPDGKLVASAYEEIKLWSVPEGNLVQTLWGHSGRVTSVTFSNDGRMLASGSRDNSIRTWSLPEGKTINTMEVKEVENPEAIVLFSPDGTMLIASLMGDYLNSLEIWSVHDNKLLHKSDGYFGSCRIDPLGKILASYHLNTIYLWSIPEMKPVRMLQGHTDKVNSVAFSPDGKMLVSCGNDNTIRIWSLTSGQLIMTSVGHSEPVRSVCFDREGKRVASGGDDRTIKLWNLESCTDIKPDGTFREGNLFNEPPYKDTGTCIAFRSKPDAVKIFDLKDNSTICTVTVPINTEAMEITPDLKYFFTGDSTGYVKWWNLSNKKKARFKAHESSIRGIHVNKENDILLTAGFDGKVKIWSFPENTCKGTLTDSFFEIRSIETSPDGKLLAFFNYSSLQLWSLETRTHLKSINFISDNFNSINAADSGGITFVPQPSQVLFTPSGAAIILVHGSGFSIYDHSSNEVIKEYKSRKSIMSISVTPDGRYIALAYEKGIIEILDFTNLEALKTIELPESNIRGIAFTGNENKLVVYTGVTIRVYQLTDFIDDFILTTCLYDKDNLAEETKGINYTSGGHTMTLPCGTAIPAGAVCTCNCITIGAPRTYNDTYSTTYYYTYWYPN